MKSSKASFTRSLLACDTAAAADRLAHERLARHVPSRELRRGGLGHRLLPGVVLAAWDWGDGGVAGGGDREGEGEVGAELKREFGLDEIHACLEKAGPFDANERHRGHYGFSAVESLTAEDMNPLCSPEPAASAAPRLSHGVPGAAQQGQSRLQEGRCRRRQGEEAEAQNKGGGQEEPGQGGARVQAARGLPPCAPGLRLRGQAPHRAVVAGLV
jgi:hypothetical protein